MICANCGKELANFSQAFRCKDGSPCFKAVCPSCSYVTWLFTNDRAQFNPTHFVHCPGRGEPKQPHKDIASAVAEAERICALNKKPVRVYQQVAVVNPVVKTEVKYG